MTIHVLIPVFNRLSMTKRVLECLRAQQVDESLSLIVIDDGSSDGTGEFLSIQQDVHTLNGDGSLWWGGAIHLGLREVLKSGNSTDWVLLVNNDTQFPVDFIQHLLNAARSQAPAVIGSVVCNEGAPDQLLSIGPVLDVRQLLVADKLLKARSRNASNGPHTLNALSGRGTLYPLVAFRLAGMMRPTLFPHYLADYELSVRVSKAGFKLLVTEEAPILSANEFGSTHQHTRLLTKFFSRGSPHYLPAVLAFWWVVSSPFERLTLFPRLIFKGLNRGLFP